METNSIHELFGHLNAEQREALAQKIEVIRDNFEAIFEQQKAITWPSEKLERERPKEKPL